MVLRTKDFSYERLRVLGARRSQMLGQCCSDSGTGGGRRRDRSGHYSLISSNHPLETEPLHRKRTCVHAERRSQLLVGRKPAYRELQRMSSVEDVSTY